MNKALGAALLLVFILTSCGKHGPKVVLILGNSITIHAPSPSLGWAHNWGMAASTRDSDYVHLLIDSIHSKDASVIIRYFQIGDFERDYRHYDLSVLNSLKNPYLLIMRIGENVNDKGAEKDGFVTHYDALIKYLDPDKTVVTDGFWGNDPINTSIDKYADEHSLPFIKLSDLSADSTNMAYGKFSNIGVQQHPSDKGMRKISARIWSIIKEYF